MVSDHTIDHGPGGLDSIFACEERVVAGQGVAQQPVVRRFLPRLRVEQ